MTMTHSEASPRGAEGREGGAVAERRRARHLGRILEVAPRLHELRDPVAVITALEGILHGMFPEATFLIQLRSQSGADSNVQEAILRTNHPDAEIAPILAAAIAVADSGVPSLGPEFAAADDGIVGCVPIALSGRTYGAIHVATPPGPVQDAEELAGLLRQLATQCALALRCVEDIRARREDMRILATETGDSLRDSGLSLGDAKRAFEHWLISVRLKEARGNIAAAARSLAMDRGQLSRLVKRHGIDARSYKD